MNESQAIKTLIEYISIDRKYKIVLLSGSWDTFNGYQKLEYQGNQIFTTIIKLPIGIYQYRFLINGEKWDINYFDAKIVLNGIKYNQIKIEPHDQSQIKLKINKKTLWSKYQILIKLKQNQWNNHIKFNKQMKIFSIHSINHSLYHHYHSILLLYGYITSIQSQLTHRIIPESLITLCFNYWYNAKENIQIFCRIRPLLTDDIKKGFESIINLNENDKTFISLPPLFETAKKPTFHFDKVYDSKTTQKQIFQDINSYLNQTLYGSNISIFCYGQTGSGKNYTINGNKDNDGLLINSLNYIFNKVNQQNNINYTVKCTVFQIYKSKINNLLIHNDNINSDQLEELFTVQTVDEVKTLLETALKYKQNTVDNRGCERSFLLYYFNIVGNDTINETKYEGKLWFVECAGSERKPSCDPQSEESKVRRSVHKALCAFGDVLQSIQRKKKFIPYKNSSFTELLSDSIGGYSDVLIYLNICPIECTYFDTKKTLKFGKSIKPPTLP